MSKDMINIDDFVREKLGSREEKEDPAAWLRMKALLDKEMPEKAIPLGFRFGKAAAFLGCALLAALVGVGGYKVLHNNTANNTPATATVSPAANGASGMNTVNSGKSTGTATDNSATAANTPANAAATTAPGNTSGANKGTATGLDNHNNNSTAANHTAAANNSTAGRNAAQQTSANTSGTDNTAANQASAVAANKNTQSNNTAAHNNRKSQREGQYNSGTAARLPHSKTGTAAGSAANTYAIAKSNTTAKQDAAIARLKPASGNSAKVTAANRPAASATGNSKAAAANKNLKGKENPASNTAASGSQSAKDSMVAVGLTQRAATSGPLPRKVTYTIDSTSLGKVAVAEDKNTAPEQPKADPNPEKQTTKTKDPRSSNPRYLGANPPKNVTPAAAAPAESPASPAAGTNTAAAEVVKKKEKREFFGFIKNIHFDEIVDNVKYDIGHAQFYMGVGGGLNYSPSGSNSFRGAQFGATGELVFNKHLSLMGELKYFNRSGSNKMVDDSYISQHTSATYDSVTSQGYWYTLRTDSTNRYFNFSTLHSFEMPITLRYAFNKFYLMTGINVAYYLGLNVEEINNHYNNINPTPTPYQISKAPEPVRQDPRLNVTDFGTRYGIGYIFGAGYQINTSTQVDLRMVSTFWDNAKGTGAKQISKDFYRIPSVQINLNYQFNRGNKNRSSFGPTGQ